MKNKVLKIPATNERSSTTKVRAPANHPDNNSNGEQTTSTKIRNNTLTKQIQHVTVAVKNKVIKLPATNERSSTTKVQDAY